MEEPALYVPDGDGFIGTLRTQGAWDPKSQNGAAVLALFGHVLEDVPTLTPMFLSRLTADLMRPVPIGPRLTVDTAVVREGKKIQLVDLVLRAGDTVHVRASALRVRVEDLTGRPGAPPSTTDADPAAVLPHPDELAPLISAERTGAPGFINGIEMRRAPVPGSDRFGYWVRLSVPVVAGEPTRATSRLAVAFDFTNTIGVYVEHHLMTTINPDVTAHVLRSPVGEWTAVYGETRFNHQIGRGISTATLSDTDGVFAVASTSQLLQAR